MYYLYILQSQKNGRYYIGSTDHLLKRFYRHQSGGNKSTRPHRPWVLVHMETFRTRGEAQKREYQVKSWKSRQAIKDLILNTKGS
ncbi:MAG: GIY-YIG nuclease family protein [Verrucomicrobiota bacterium]